MRAITVRQPWAHLIVTGRKSVEHRSWRTHHRGPLLIHAGQEIDQDGPEIKQLVLGAIIGVVDLVYSSAAAGLAGGSRTRGGSSSRSNVGGACRFGCHRVACSRNCADNGGDLTYSSEVTAQKRSREVAPERDATHSHAPARTLLDPFRDDQAAPSEA
jgi:hypothetical protein